MSSRSTFLSVNFPYNLQSNPNINDLVTSPFNFKESSQQILKEIGELLGFEVGVLWLVDGASNVLRCKEFWTNNSHKYHDFELVTRNLILKPQLDLPGQVWSTQKTIFVADLSQYPNSSRRLHWEKAGFNSAFVIPIQTKVEIFAIIEFFGEKIFDSQQDLSNILMGIEQKITQMSHLQDLEIALLEESKLSSNLKLILSTMEDGIVVLDEAQNCIFMNDGAKKLFHDTQNYLFSVENLEQLPQIIFLSDDLNQGNNPINQFKIDQLPQIINQATFYNQPIELLLFDPNKSKKIWLKITTKPLHNNNNYEGGTILICRDITQSKELQHKTKQEFLYDSLTGLGNRQLFIEVLNQSILLNKDNPDYDFGVFFVDINRFKIINDSLGHLIGDQLIVAIAERLQSCLRNNDIITRFGGDEFAILCKPVKNIQSIQEIAQRLHQTLQNSFNLDGQEIFINVSIGITLRHEQHLKPEDYIRNASTAMYQAKRLGKGGYQIFDENLAIEAVKQLQLESDLQKAIDQNQFQLYYQPIVYLKNQKITGFESLIRWQHPDKGWISPDQFIPLAEETGLIIAIGNWVLEEACSQMKQWQEEFPETASWVISVNVSGKQLSHPDFIPHLHSVLDKTGLKPTCLKLEMTESILIEEHQSILTVLQQVRELGIKLALDDFGTGYSSLSYLHQFAFDTLKIDRSFINSIDVSYEKLNIIRAIVALAGNLGMDVVAEGIEESNQLAHLKVLKCQYGQGYFFSKPLEEKIAKASIQACLEAEDEQESCDNVFLFQEQIAKEKLLVHIEKLSHELEELKQEKEDLEIMLDVTTEHADIFEAELQEEIQQYQEAEEELNKRNQQLQTLSLLDGLTQISNRRHFDLYLEEQWIVLKQGDQPLSLILGDIDCFKQYNDYYGHQAGDQCLIKVAKILTRPIKPPVDMVARYGGEEFAIILPNTNAGGALKVAQQVQDELKNLKINHDKSLVKPYITMSLGVVSLAPKENESIENLIALADKALYQAKTQGRNRFMLCSI
jgi:diguanylate cyclase (GGDEF)-like protein